MTATTETLRQCTHCLVSQPPSSFSPNPRRRDGLQSWCTSCHADNIRERRREPGFRERERAAKRAKERAMEALARAHPEEFDALHATERVVEGLSPILWDRAS